MNIFKGTFTALVTPFKNGGIDFQSLEKLIQHQLSAGVTGFVVNGTTAESPTLSSEEVAQIYTFIRSKVGNKVPLILGTGSNSTEKTITDTKKAKELGADAVLVVVPYYNKPPQRGLVAHFKAIANAVDIPNILYNVPGRTITSLSSESVRELSQVKNIFAIKDATGDMAFLKENRAVCGGDFIQLSGDDGTYVDFLELGGDGVISVATHVIPAVMVEWKNLVAANKIQEAKASIAKYKKLIDLLFIEANPIPVKKALQLMGIIESAELRLPLVELSEEATVLLRAEMKALGLI